MKIKTNMCSVVLALTAPVLFLILISSTVSAAALQNPSSNGPFAYITNYNSDTVSIIDTATNTVTATVHVGSYPSGVAVNPDGTKVYVTNQRSNSVSIIDTATNTVLATVSVGTYPIGIAVSPDGKKVYVANDWQSNTISVIDTKTNMVTATVPVGKWPWGVAVTPDGTKVYVANQESNTVSVLDATTNSLITEINVGTNPHGMTVNSDGTKVYVTNRFPYNDHGTVSIIDTATNTVTATVPVGVDPMGVAVNPAGTKVYVTNYGGTNVSVIDTTTDTVTSTVNVGNSPRGVAVTPDGKRIYVANTHSNDISVIDTATNTVTATVNVGTGPLAFGQFIGGKRILPAANFSNNATRGNSPLSVQFNDNSENTSAVSWDFGDGTSSTDPNPVHTYSKIGNYTVNLTAINGYGTDSKLAVIKVLTQPVLPIADFTTNVTRGYAPLGVQFTDYSDNAIERKWDFGDGNVSTDLNPVHTYSKAGTYTVNLTAINRNGPNSKLTTVAVVPPLKITETQITTNESDQYRPVIYGDRIVWLDLRNGNTSSIKFDIYMYNLSTGQETQITTNGSGGVPAMYNDRIIWGGISTHNGTRKMNLYMYNLSTQQKTQITSDKSVDPCDAAIYGDRIVWNDYRNADFNADVYYPDIYMYNLSTSKEVQITTNRSVGRSLDIYGDRIVWQDERNGTHIYMYNISTNTETQITNHESPQMLPSIYGDRIVWADLRNGGYNIYMYNLSTLQETQITTSGTAWNPKINGNRIVWVDSRNGRGDIYMYDLSTSTETQITNEAYHGYPAIYGDKIVWMDNRNGNYDIYMCTVSAEDSELKPVSDWEFFPNEPVSGDILNINGSTSPGEKVDVFATFEKTVPASDRKYEYTLENVIIPEGLDNAFTIEAKGAKNLNVRVKMILWVTKSSNALGDTAVVSQSNVPPGTYQIKIDGNASEGVSEVNLKIIASHRIQADSNGNFSYFYNTTVVPPGNFEVRVGDITKEITLRPKEAEQPSLVLPVANFSTNVSEFFAPQTVQFTDLSQNATSMNWNFGDGSTSTEQNPMHTYYAAGSYTANLTVFNEKGTDSKSTTITVFENPLIVLPIASFSTNTTEGFAPLSVQFNDSSENATFVNWDFGDGNNSTERNPIHEFITPGIYTVNLTSTNANGTDLKSARITVTELLKVLPVANFSSNVTQGSAPLFVQFTDLSENATGWDWNFGDGSNSSNQNPVHTYSVAGNYTVNLTSTNANGTDSKLAQITVLEKTIAVLPVADFTSNITQGYAPLFIQFTDMSKNITEYNWNFGDGSNSTEQNPMHEYIAPGNYTVILTASNGNSTDSKSDTINVFEKPVLPAANFSTNVSEGFAPLSVQFNDSSENATFVNWNFGDGNNSTERNLIHEFTLPGNYTVNLTVANENGTDSKSDTINVIGKSAVIPAANFSSNVSTGNAPLSVQFTDLSENATEWNWSFGDGASSEEQNPMHTYSIAGNYTVTLTANNSAGSNTVTKYNYTTVVKLDDNIIEGRAPLSVQFTDLSEGATSWNWDFGDGNTSTEQNPTHTYNETGQYTVTLTANNMAGSNVITKNSYIIVTNSMEAPIADFSVSTTSGKAPLNISFMDKSTGSPNSWKWSFGDGNVSIEQNIMHTYTIPGQYTVTLTANNSAGSSAVTKYSYIIVTNFMKAPVADFSASVTS